MILRSLSCRWLKHVAMGLLLVGVPAAAQAAGPADIAGRAGFVPIKDVTTEAKGKPFECSGFDPATESCTVISVNRLDGGTLQSMSRILINAEPRVEVHLNGTFDVVNGAVCGDAATWDIDVLGDVVTEPVANEIANAIRQSAGQFGKTCVGYFRDKGRLRVLNFSAETGERIDEIPEAYSVFFEKEPDLRAAQ